MNTKQIFSKYMITSTTFKHLLIFINVYINQIIINSLNASAALI